MMPKLSNQTLHQLRSGVIKPLYNRSAVSNGIVHIGIGNFHRAHEAVYTDSILNLGDLRWGITGVSLRSADIYNALSPQDGLYTLGMKSGLHTEWRVIGAVQNILYAPHDTHLVVETIASKHTRIISLTVTEKAYCLKPDTGDLDPSHPDVQHDLSEPNHPCSLYGFLFAGLALRHQRNLPLPTLLSCDNLTSNGRRLRKALIQFASLRDPQIAMQLDKTLSCPSTMVDRIVPQTTDADRIAVKSAIGLDDAWPVTTEPFAQWVIEDDFPLGRPEWDLFGAEFVKDAQPYERMKLSLLNASHSALAFLGLIAGYKTVSDAMNDPVLDAFIMRFMQQDIAPILSLPSEMNVNAYIPSLQKRFKNSALHHQLGQIASDSSQKISQRFIPTIHMRLKQNQPLSGFAYAIAAFVLALEGRSETGDQIEFNDPRRETLQSLLRSSTREERISALLHQSDIFGHIAHYPDAISEIQNAYTKLKLDGVQHALKSRR